MTNQPLQLALTLDAGPEADVEDLEVLTRQLRQELLELDVEAVDLARGGELPEKAKAGDPITWGTLLLSFISGGGLVGVINLLPAWLKRNELRSVTLEVDGDKLEVKGVTSEQQQQLIDAWLRRRRGFYLTND